MSASVPTTVPDAATTVRPGLLSRPLLLVFLAGFGAMVSFYLLLSVVPLYAAHAGGGRLQSGLIPFDALPLVLAVCAVRGFGFAIIVVVGAALVASLVPRECRGEGLGRYGVALGTVRWPCSSPGCSSRPPGCWRCSSSRIRWRW